jgi:hypothetical protein
MMANAKRPTEWSHHIDIQICALKECVKLCSITLIFYAGIGAVQHYLQCIC